jgi:hypothetical protein
MTGALADDRPASAQDRPRARAGGWDLSIYQGRRAPLVETGPTSPGVRVRPAAAGSSGALSATSAGARTSEGLAHPTEEAA